MRATPLVLALAKAMVLVLCQRLPPLSMGHPASRLLDSQPVSFGMGHFNQVETIYNYTKKHDRKVNPIDMVILRCSVFWGTAIFSFALGLDVVIMISDFHQHDDWFVVSKGPSWGTSSTANSIGKFQLSSWIILAKRSVGRNPAPPWMVETL